MPSDGQKCGNCFYFCEDGGNENIGYYGTCHWFPRKGVLVPEWAEEGRCYVQANDGSLCKAWRKRDAA